MEQSSLAATDKWKTRDGRAIPIREMSDSHLRNAYNMLSRNGYVSPSTVLCYLSAPPPRGEMAQYYYEQEMDSVFQAPVTSILDAFEKEADRRGIILCK